jgi:ubiquinone/menaquinone biosynthesis C-methylase UbiE
MIYQHPLAYLLGLEGIALLRGWAGDFDQRFVDARIADVRALLDDPRLVAHPGVQVARADVETGYRQWAETYDEPNGLFDIEEPVMHEILDDVPVGRAIDAACGTGRYAAYLARRGHTVIGVDSSAEMLPVARSRTSGCEFLIGAVDLLPIDSGSADLVVCALALAHVPALPGVMAEFARVLRPGGHLVISDAHRELVFRGSVVKAMAADGGPGLVATYRHTTGDYLRAALPVGFRVRRCDEPVAARIDDQSAPLGSIADIPIGTWDDWPWSLLAVIPDAARAAWAAPSAIVWHFELGA